MNQGIKQALFFSGVAAFLTASTGCGVLPHRNSKAAETITAEQYAQQAVENIDYDSIDFARDESPTPMTKTGYVTTSISDRTPAASSAGDGSCCSH